MGQIIIELPGNINRRYLVEDSESVEPLLDDIEIFATRVKNGSAAIVRKNPVRLSAQDEADLRAVNRARKGDLVSWKDAKAYLETLD